MTGLVTWPADAITPDFPSDQAIRGAPMLTADPDGDGKAEVMAGGTGGKLYGVRPVNGPQRLREPGVSRAALR